MLFYGNYLRYNERAANACLGNGSNHATLCRVTLAKYVKSVRWNETVHIRTLLVPGALVGENRSAGSTHAERSLLHEWLVDDSIVFISICTYIGHGAFNFDAAIVPDVKEERRIKALLREAADTFVPQSKGAKHEINCVYPDMISASGTLTVPSVMDLFERQRTKLIGDQAELQRLKTEDDIMIVVYLIQQLELPPDTTVQPQDEIEISSAFT
eukprot:CAMPEP_0119331708 /NCGR_PEP_ID=MMETSP1333-20130426/81220_1 /TAXON_ID=418940 /ORGANISM="Scyphosphaera apsteinii, Strain RCC1455" /LENGTH=212 /DNA_ID=CAMNT_0007341377 /DNA_START=139 /DNA_END=773 /DNA_ORIENTATION=+